MNTFVGSNNSGKTNVLRALDLFFSKKVDFDPLDDAFKAGEEIANESSIRIGINGIEESECLELSPNIKDLIVNKILLVERVFTWEKNLTNEFFVSGSANSEKVSVKRNDISGFIEWLPDYIFVAADQEPEKTISMLGKAILQNLKKDSAVMQIANRLQEAVRDLNSSNVLLNLNTRYSELLREWWPGVEPKLRISNIDFDALGKSLLIDVKEADLETSITEKGDGLQRSAIMTVFRLYAEMAQSATETKSMLFAFDEPELYLHPHQQRSLLLSLQQASKKNQLFLCTHSPYLVDLHHIESIKLVRQTAYGTEVREGKRNYNSDERSTLVFINKVSSASELFFAKKVILFEGESEKGAYHLLAERFIGTGSLEKLGITLVNCQGKTNIQLFIPILVQFRIPFLVVFDKDTHSQSDQELNHSLEISAEDPEGDGKFIVLNPDFEVVFGVTPTQVRNNGKPKACYDRAKIINFEDLDQNLKKILEWISA